jgi:cobalt/nickel transport system permease protein
MVGSLFLRGFERSERIYLAMLSRGYTGEVRTLALDPLTPRQRALLGAGLALLAMLLGAAYLFWG